MKAKFVAIMNGFVDIFVALIEGIKLQIATGKGALVFIVLMILCVDVVMKGDIGIINFIIIKFKILASILKDNMAVVTLIGLGIIFKK